MKVESEYKGNLLELSKPVFKMAWDEAIQQEWPDGWRIPTRAELVTMFDEATNSGHKFTDTSFVWSASSYAPGPASAWGVYFGGGSSNAFNKTGGYAVRLVREVRK